MILLAPKHVYEINQQDATLAVLCLLTTTSMLYMFRTPFYVHHQEHYKL